MSSQLKNVLSQRNGWFHLHEKSVHFDLIRKNEKKWQPSHKCHFNQFDSIHRKNIMKSHRNPHQKKNIECVTTSEISANEINYLSGIFSRTRD